MIFNRWRRSVDHLGRAQGRPRYRLLPHGKADQSRSASPNGLHRHLLSSENRESISGLGQGRRNRGRL